ncbi:MAG TPA: tRNA pseudouridine(38-40) synthase TruA [Bryobacteraceae bacterium]|nr:tRNA pseudouridine(38-40) synthase TruA [Bryobacteraceae bacterium]
MPALRAGHSSGEARLAPGLMDSRRIKITLSYDGAGFHGWQIQPGLPTIQGLLEDIVSGMEGKRVHVAGSGRTDAGVHALAQVAAFTLENPIPVANLRRALNRLLPPTVRILTAEEVAPGFHPRFDAKAKVYEYRIARGEVCSPFEWPWVHHHPYPLAEDRMIALARTFEGEHDFSAFAAADERDAEGRSKVRTIFCSELSAAPGRLIYRVRGSGFLKHMVRNIVGTLLEAGKGNIEDLSVLPAKSGPTAPAKGLFLVRVEY